jgi:protein-S-isoprenylcysteine O-methyltransferase Ste14
VFPSVARAPSREFDAAALAPPVDLIRDIVARAFVAGLFAMMSVNLLGDFMRTGHITGLLLLASESLVVVLTLVRRRSNLTDRSIAATVATTLSLAGPPLVRAADGHALVPDAATAVLSVMGLLVVIAGKVALGRSFGIVPANRGIVARGPYALVRHPIYSGYLVTHIGFAIAHPSAWNLTVLAIADSALVVRALIEERLLRTDRQYESYCGRVSWHFVPGVF